MIDRQTAYFSVDKNRPALFYRLTIPENQQPKATILLIHGMQEHSGRYNELATFLAASGIAVMSYDHSGHGKSVKSASELGFFSKQDPAKQLINDALQINRYFQLLYPEVPHFILSHSMGSFITRCLLSQTENPVQGVILVGTGGKLPGISILKSAFYALNKLSPHHRTAFNQIFNAVNNMHFKGEKEIPGAKWLSLSKTNRQAFANDPLCGVPFTHNGYFGLFSVYKQATSNRWTQKIPKQLPFLFVSGKEDPIGNFGKGVQQAANQLKSAGFSDIQVQLYDQMRHEILNEDIRQKVYQLIINWIEEQLKERFQAV